MPYFLKQEQTFWSVRCNIIFGPNVLNMYANCILDRITFGHDISLCLCNVVQVCQYGSCLFDYIYIYIKGECKENFE